MLLTAEHISLNFGLKQLLDDVTLYLNEGDKTGIIGTPGTAFGPHGEGYVRFALVRPADEMARIAEMIGDMLAAE